MDDPLKKPCPFPFTQLFLHPDGRVSPCCWLHEYELGDARAQSLEEIWNGEKMRALRREFIAGAPRTCAAQILHSHCNLNHPRLEPLVELKEELPTPIKRLDLMLNGRCNLECVMCDVWYAPNGTYDATGFWKEGPERIFPHLKEIDVKGGEPFVQRDVFRLIDEVSRVNPGCGWLFTTNGHYRFNDTIRRALDKLRLVCVSVSVDSLVPEAFSKIRIKGDLRLVLQTLDRLIEYRDGRPPGRGFPIWCNMVVQRDNWREVPDMVRFCARKGILPYFLMLSRPPELSLMRLPQPQRDEIVRFYLIEARGLKDDRIVKLAGQILRAGASPEAVSGYFDIVGDLRAAGVWDDSGPA